MLKASFRKQAIVFHNSRLERATSKTMDAASIAAVDVRFHACGDYISIIRQLKQQGAFGLIFRGRRCSRAQDIQQCIVKLDSGKWVRTVRLIPTVEYPEFTTHEEVESAGREPSEYRFSREQGQGMCAAGALVRLGRWLRQLRRPRSETAVQTLSVQNLGIADLGEHLFISFKRGTALAEATQVPTGIHP